MEIKTRRIDAQNALGKLMKLSLNNDNDIGAISEYSDIIASFINESPFCNNINRLEVIDNNGRTYSNYNIKEIKPKLQDYGKTLKLFIKD